jgi:hypothetical protein
MGLCGKRTHFQLPFEFLGNLVVLALAHQGKPATTKAKKRTTPLLQGS